MNNQKPATLTMEEKAKLQVLNKSIIFVESMTVSLKMNLAIFNKEEELLFSEFVKKLINFITELKNGEITLEHVSELNKLLKILLKNLKIYFIKNY